MGFLQGYRTLIFNGALFAVMLFRSFSPDTVLPEDQEIRGTLDSLLEHADAIIAVVGNFILRFVTKGPVGEKV